MHAGPQLFFKVVYLTIVMFNDLNVVLSATLVPTRVEVAGIFASPSIAALTLALGLHNVSLAWVVRLSTAVTTEWRLASGTERGLCSSTRSSKLMTSLQSPSC